MQASTRARNSGRRSRSQHNKHAAMADQLVANIGRNAGACWLGRAGVPGSELPGSSNTPLSRLRTANSPFQATTPPGARSEAPLGRELCLFQQASHTVASGGRRSLEPTRGSFAVLERRKAEFRPRGVPAL